MRPDHRPWAAWFFGLILFAVVLALSGVRPNERTEIDAAGPGWDPDRLLDDQYYRELDTWALENGSLEGIGRLARFHVDYTLFNDSTATDVIAGDNGWLFFRPFGEIDCNRLDGLQPIDTSAAPAGTVQQIVTLPKIHWLASTIPERERPEACTGPAREAMSERFLQSPTDIDLNGVIAEQPAAFFEKKISTWNAEGQIAAARAIIDHYQPGLWDDDAVVSGTREATPALPQIMGNTGTAVFPTASTERADVAVNEIARNELLGSVAFARTTVSPRGGGDEDGDNGPAPAVVPGVTYIVGDLEVTPLLPLLTPYFEELVFFGWSQLAFGDFGLDFLPPPDRLLIESSESTALQFADDERLAALIAAVGSGS